MRRKGLIIIAFGAVACAVSVSAFAPHTRAFHRFDPAHTNTRTRSSPLLEAKLQDGGGNKLRDVFLLSLDGTLLSNTRTKSKIAIQAALRVWPELVSTAYTLNMNVNSLDDECWNWLVEKLSALASITQQGNAPDKMLGCDAVFLTRVLLEEQLLDGGRSNGRGGKYGGKYHPGWTSDFDSDGSVVGSRPLTVGELYTNWEELREVMEFKYPVVDEETQRKSDPMPLIRQVLRDLYSDASLNTKSQRTMHPLAYDVLLRDEIRQNSMLLLGHEAQLPSALASLVSMGISYTVNLDLDWESPQIDEWFQSQAVDKEDTSIHVISSEKASDYFSSRDDSSIVLVVPNSEKRESQQAMIERIVLALDAQSNSLDSSNADADEMYISIVHSSLDVLKRCKCFLEDDL